MSNSEWKEVRLGDILADKGYIRGPFGSALKRAELKESGIPVYEQQNIINNHREFRYYIDEEKYSKLKRFTVKVNDLLISCSGTVGKVSMIEKEDPIGIISQALLILRPEVSVVDKSFLYYFLTSRIGYNSITSVSTGSVQVNIAKRKIVENIELNLPPLPEQKAIAKILSDLDEKIEINNRINKNLEEMAQAIFKEWFVDFNFPNEQGLPYKDNGGEMVESELGLIPKGWNIFQLDEIVELIKDNIKKEKLSDDLVYTPIDTLPMKSLTMKEFRPVNEAKSSLQLYKQNDILLGAMRVYFHRVVLAPKSGVTRTTTFVIRSRTEKEIPYNLLLLTQDETIKYADKTSKGTTMPYAIWNNGIANMLIVNPSYKIKEKFYEVIYDSIRKMNENAKENEQLKQLRDTLLPKLMSGELRVPVIKEN